MCQNCNKHKGTENWVGDGGMMGFVHGQYQKWCKCCCVKAQIEDAELAVKRLPKLKKELKESCVATEGKKE